MDQSQSDQSEETSKISINNLDTFDFDDLNFKPINKGLGFHHKEKRVSFKKETMHAKRVHRGNLTKGIASRQMSSKCIQPALSNLGVSQKIDGVAAKSSLDIFYGRNEEHNNVKARSEVKEKLEAQVIMTEEASRFMCFVAWLVDLIILVSISSFTVGLFIIASGIAFNELVGLISLSEKLSFVGLVFSTYYIIYFSILDLASSPGKALMALSLEKIDKSELRFKDSFTRSLVGLISLIFLGVPCLFKLSDKLSNTRTVH